MPRQRRRFADLLVDFFADFRADFFADFRVDFLAAFVPALRAVRLVFFAAFFTAFFFAAFFFAAFFFAAFLGAAFFAEPAFDVGSVLACDGVVPATVVRLYRTGNGAKPSLPEGVVNLTGYNLLGAGRVEDAITIFELNVAAFPRSPNVYDSLGDALLAKGDTAGAREVARKANELLRSDTTIDPERKKRIQDSIDQKLRGAGKSS